MVPKNKFAFDFFPELRHKIRIMFQNISSGRRKKKENEKWIHAWEKNDFHLNNDNKLIPRNDVCHIIISGKFILSLKHKNKEQQI